MVLQVGPPEGVEYTLTEDLMQIGDKDPTVEVIGYVDKIIATTQVGSRGVHYRLFKFIISNSQKRITVLVWGDELIRKYEPEITSNRILHIDGAEAKLSNPSYIKDPTRMLQIELIIQKKTIVNYLGHHNTAEIEQMVNIIPQVVTFDSIRNATGLIVIQAYLKTKFVLTSHRGTSSYGLGAITNCVYKIPVQIINYNSAFDIEKGVCIKVVGTIRNEGCPFTIICQNIDAIQQVPGVAAKSPSELIRGVRLIKRTLTQNED